jgi:hypothetical protein
LRSILAQHEYKKSVLSQRCQGDAISSWLSTRQLPNENVTVLPPNQNAFERNAFISLLYNVNEATLPGRVGIV